MRDDRASALSNIFCEGCARKNRLRLSDCVDESAERALGIAVEHARIVFEKERVFDSGESLSLAALEHDDGARAVHVEDRHAGDGAAWVVTCVGVPTSFAPMTMATSVFGKSELICSSS